MIQKVTASVILTFALGCSSQNSQSQSVVSSPELVLAGKITLADGTAVANQEAELRMVIGGVGLFPEGPSGCGHSDPHMSGQIVRETRINETGRYDTSFVLAQARSVTDPGCEMGGAPPERVESLLLVVQVLANEVTCPSFCSAQGASAAPDCVPTCTSGSRVLRGSKAIPPEQVSAAMRIGGSMRIEHDLVLGELGPPITAGGPDLTVNREAALSSARVSRESFAPDSCAVFEQCVSGPGERTLLRFDGNIQNLGDAPFFLGAPEGNPKFEYSACHDHFHLKDMMLYELFSSDGRQPVVVNGQRVVGRKQGFCMMDIFQVNAASESNGYTCEYQGISSGWEDAYDNDLDCQWLDVTGVPAGSYVLRITVNAESAFDERDLGNNAAAVPVKIP